HGEVAFPTQVELDLRAGDDPDVLQLLGVDVQLDVAVVIDVEHGREDALGRQVGNREVEPGQRVHGQERAKLLQVDAVADVGGGGREEVASVERPRDRVQRVVGV